MGERSGLRWRVDPPDGPGEEQVGQPALFPGAERHVGRGEYRGLTFLHVQARSVINRVQGPGRLPFTHTINAYRGCSHACTYCFARPTHDHLGLDIDEGFEREIVVKVNAVEVLRAELRPARWAGHHIAMGTNTDPYQRAEGRYRLTRGIVEVLAEHANPFSILTKSTLVLRDLDLLVVASARTDVSVNLSIGTLDEAVWRATEPGTPHPRQRVAAVARLVEAGVRCGVLVAPVLPGLSDAAAQLDEVVAACVDAGAASIGGGMLLRLQPGVRDVYLRHLARTHPELVASYERLYTRANAPAREQERVSRLVAEAVARHRGTSVPLPRPGRDTVRRHPAAGRPPASPSPPAPEQLGLRA